MNYYNGSNYDPAYSNVDVVLLPSASRTTTQTSADLINNNGRHLVVTLDVTTPGTGSITLSINGKDPASGKYINILTGAAVTTAVTNKYKVSMSLATVANSVAQDILPRTFQIVVTHNNANAITYSVGYSIIL